MANQTFHQLEKKGKQWLWKFIGLCAGKAPSPPDLPLDFTSINKVLVIRTDRLGDVVLSIPVYETLKKNFPHLEISVLVDRPQAGLLAESPSISQVFSFDGKKPLETFRQLKDEHFDLAMTLNKNFSGTATFFTLCSGAKIRIGYDHPENKWAHNIRVSAEGPPCHETENNLQLLRKLGIKKIISQPRFYFSLEETKKIEEIVQKFRLKKDRPVVMIKSGTRIAKWGWQWKKFETVIESLLESENAEVWVVNGPGEEVALKEAIAKMQNKPQLLPQLTAKELALLLQECDVLLCNHTGIMHLASAVDKPTCVIFKHGEIKRWGPMHQESAVLEERDEDSLPPKIVLSTLKKILNTNSHSFIKEKS